MNEQNEKHVEPADGAPPSCPATGEAEARSTVPLVVESAEIDKVEVDRGGYRVTKRVGEHEQEVSVALQRQDVDIERHPIGEWVSEMPQIRHEGDTLIVPVVEEVLVTEKRLRLVEEVRIRQTHDTRRISVPVTLHKETIEIERLPARPPVDTGPA